MPLMQRSEADAQRVTAWECVGCGKIDAPQPCIGICQDRKVEFVYAAEYDKALAQLDFERQRVRTAESLLQRIVHTKPHKGDWERSYLALQDQARRALAALAADIPAGTNA